MVAVAKSLYIKMPEMAQLQNCLPHKHEDLPSNHLYPCKKPDTTIWLCQLLASVCICTHMHTHTNAETKCPHIHTLSHTRPLSVVLKLLYQNHLESYLGPWGFFHLSLDTAIWQRCCPPQVKFPSDSETPYHTWEYPPSLGTGCRKY